MDKLVINQDVFRDKIMGCWLGKNAGGTLGEPVEGKFGQDEMFNLDWYPDLPEGGIPNDDLELQLIWLQLIMEKGPGLTSADMVDAWMDCIAYNFDEYGLSKANMQKGLLPPVCGWHNNPFRDCMGSPIRSEIWACLAPGCLSVAAKYAFQDAIVDHGGGESVYGEIFNAVLESAAFFNDDKFELLDLALSTIPESCITYQCVKKSIDNFHKGMSYVDNRNDLKNRFYNPVAQYSPLNLGFQTIGWLYGTDFGDSICKAVNCGWDTDCTAATLGAILGIIGGAKSLPKKWIEPLGDEITTNMSTGGIRNLTAPTNIYELTDVVCELSKKVVHYWNCDVEFSDTKKMSKEVSFPKPDLSWMNDYQSNAIVFHLGDLTEELVYHEDAAILANRPSKVSLVLKNPHPIEKKVSIELTLPEGFTVEPANKKSIEINAFDSFTIDYAISANEMYILDSNRINIIVETKEQPVIPAIPLILLGGSKWLVSPFFKGKHVEDDCGIDESKIFAAKPEGFIEVWRASNKLELEDYFKENGVVYALHQIYCEQDMDIVFGVPNNGKMKLFVNGKFIHETQELVPVRANLGNGGALGDLSNYKVDKLLKGWNQILIKLESVVLPEEAHFTMGGMSTVCYKNHGMPVSGLKRSLFQWQR